MKRIFKALGWLIGGGLALVVACYVVVVLINLRDRPPSEFALRLEDIHRNRPAVDDADNAFVYLMAFEAAPDLDPQEVGLRRVEWLKHRAEHPEDLAQPDPLQPSQPTPSPAAQQILDACKRQLNECDTVLAANDATLPDWFIAEQWRVDRYRTLLARPGWLETAPPDLSMTLPGYTPAMDAQKLLLAQAYHLAGRKDANGVREILEQDGRFWRGVLAQSDLLISRMIAVAALTRHFNMGNLALRRLPPEAQLAAMPEAWRTPLTEQELSWHRCLAGEWVYSRNILREIQTANADATPIATEWGAGPRFLQKLQDLAMRPLFQLQDTSNQSAEMFVRAADALQVPLEQFIDSREAVSKILAAPAERLGSLGNLYNPMGDILSAIGSGSFDSYPPRVADMEGVRRVAVLATELRSRKVDVTNVHAEIDASELRVPYTGVPFVWDSNTQSIVFIGLVPNERGTYAFKY